MLTCLFTDYLCLRNKRAHLAKERSLKYLIQFCNDVPY